MTKQSVVWFFSQQLHCFKISSQMLPSHRNSHVENSLEKISFKWLPLVWKWVDVCSKKSFFLRNSPCQSQSAGCSLELHRGCRWGLLSKRSGKSHESLAMLKLTFTFSWLLAMKFKSICQSKQACRTPLLRSLCCWNVRANTWCWQTLMIKSWDHVEAKTKQSCFGSCLRRLSFQQQVDFFFKGSCLPKKSSNTKMSDSRNANTLLMWSTWWETEACTSKCVVCNASWESNGRHASWNSAGSESVGRHAFWSSPLRSVNDQANLWLAMMMNCYLFLSTLRMPTFLGLFSRVQWKACFLMQSRSENNLGRFFCSKWWWLSTCCDELQEVLLCLSLKCSGKRRSNVNDLCPKWWNMQHCCKSDCKWSVQSPWGRPQ